MRVVIVGGGAGGLSTASNIRKHDKDADIKVITRDKHVAYSPCAIPYVMCGEVECFDDIVMHRPEDYRERNIDILTETEVEAIDPQKKDCNLQGKGRPQGDTLRRPCPCNRRLTLHTTGGGHGP